MTSSPPDDDRSHWERMLAGELYIADDPQITSQQQRARRMEAVFNRAESDDDEGRRSTLAEWLGAIGPDAVIRPPLHCDYGTHLRIGSGTFVNFGLVALDVAPITIGNDVQIGPNVQLLTPTHPLDPDLRRAKWEAAEPIVIEDNVWLGGGVIVLPGVTIGENSVIGAGAVVTTDVPPNVVAGGNPARIIHSLVEDD